LIQNGEHWYFCTTVVFYICFSKPWYLYREGAALPINALISQKGGTGKTTLATNLACAFTDSGDVILLDPELQGSAWE